jgi:hypothetical protein
VLPDFLSILVVMVNGGIDLSCDDIRWLSSEGFELSIVIA